MGKRVDATQKEIVKGVRAAGMSVLSIAPLGKGAPDANGFRLFTCETCGRVSQKKTRMGTLPRFCSPECLAFPPIECLNCKVMFTPGHRSKGKAVYCSRKCTGSAIGKKGESRNRGALITYTCEWCNRQFFSYYKNRKFCSRKCSGLGKEPTTCGRYSGGIDVNQAEIVAALRKVGANVLLANRLGRGCPDLIVVFRNHVFLMEVKNSQNSYGRRGFSKSQQRFYDGWRGEKPIIVTTAEGAIRALFSGPHKCNSDYAPAHEVESLDQALALLSV